MKRFLIIPVMLLAVSCASQRSGYELTWQKFPMDGHRTGVTAPNADNVAEAIGTYNNGTYTSPNGNVYNTGCTAPVAEKLLEAQPAMARLKEVIGHSSAEMVRKGPNATLPIFASDALLQIVADATGRKVDMSVINLGGIRVDMPAGDVLLDDIVSMFPFNNKLCLVVLKGSDLTAFLESQAKHMPQAMSGLRMEIKDHKIVSALVGGKPIDPDKLYNVGTIDFLLDGGDDIYLAKNAQELIITDTVIGPAMVQYVRNLTAAGKDVQATDDGRMIINNPKRERK